MVTYEAKSSGLLRGWFYWNFKVEGGAFAEWDYLRGVREGWIHKTERGVASFDRFGTCEDILMRTDDNDDVVHEFPDPKSFPEGTNWQGVVISDDLVVSHGQSLMSAIASKLSNTTTSLPPTPPISQLNNTTIPGDRASSTPNSGVHHHAFNVFIVVVLGMLIYRFVPWRRQRYSSYQSLDSNRGSYQMNV
jgi:hypothetical protein